MARKKKTIEEVEREQELREAQTDLADYGRDAEVDSLTKAVQEATEGLSKAGGGKFQPKAAAAGGDGDGDGEEDEGDEEGDADEGEDEDQDEDEDEGDEDGEGEGDEEAPPARAPAPAAKKRPMPPMQRSRSGYDAGESFLKSVLLDDDGEPTAEAEVIEVSDVLTHMTDMFAKSIDQLQQEIGMLQLQLDEAMPLLKAMGHHQIGLGKLVKSTRGELARLVKGGAGATKPAPGVTHSMKKSMPGVVQNGQTSPLSKSQVAAGLMAAYQTRAISSEQYQRLGPALDTQGIDAVLAQLPDGMAEQIRMAAAVSGNGNGNH